MGQPVWRRGRVSGPGGQWPREVLVSARCYTGLVIFGGCRRVTPGSRVKVAAGAGRNRLHGAGMASGPARAALRREVAAAAGARFEPEFFAALETAGLLVRLRPG